MREIRTSGSEGGGTGNSTGPSYPYHIQPIIPHQRGKNHDVQTMSAAKSSLETSLWDVKPNRSLSGGVAPRCASRSTP